jgi:ATP-dependent RNA helicase DHX8/PRP22
VYHELITTTRPFLRNVCKVEEAWLAPLMPRLNDMDVARLSGGVLASEKAKTATATAAKEEKAAAGRVVCSFA